MQSVVDSIEKDNLSDVSEQIFGDTAFIFQHWPTSYYDFQRLLKLHLRPIELILPKIERTPPVVLRHPVYDAITHPTEESVLCNESDRFATIKCRVHAKCEFADSWTMRRHGESSF